MTDTLPEYVGRVEGVTMVLFRCVYVEYSTGVAVVVAESGNTYIVSLVVTNAQVASLYVVILVSYV